MASRGPGYVTKTEQKLRRMGGSGAGHNSKGMTEAEGMQAFIAHMLTYTVRLVRAEPNTFPVGIASGFIIPVGDHYRIMSAGHAISAKPNWAMETVQVSDRETLMLTLRNVHAVAKINEGDPTNSMDIAWADLFPEELKAELARAPKKPLEPLELPVYRGPLDSNPDPDVPYGFAAWNDVAGREEAALLLRRNRNELNMRYVGIEPSNGLYRFEPVKFQGDAVYRGASGAPIADPEGLIVSMLVGGNPERTQLWGVPLADHAGKLTAK